MRVGTRRIRARSLGRTRTHTHTIGKRRRWVGVLAPSLAAAPTGRRPAPTATARSARRIPMQRTRPPATTTSARSLAPQLTLR